MVKFGMLFLGSALAGAVAMTPAPASARHAHAYHPVAASPWYPPGSARAWDGYPVYGAWPVNLKMAPMCRAWDDVHQIWLETPCW